MTMYAVTRLTNRLCGVCGPNCYLEDSGRTMHCRVRNTLFSRWGWRGELLVPERLYAWLNVSLAACRAGVQPAQLHRLVRGLVPTAGGWAEGPPPYMQHVRQQAARQAAHR